MLNSSCSYIILLLIDAYYSSFDSKLELFVALLLCCFVVLWAGASQEGQKKKKTHGKVNCSLTEDS